MQPRIETITTKQILLLLEQQAYRCALTGWELTPETASIDHITPLAKGGDHHIDNAQIVDWRVNQAKGSMSNSEFIEMCKAIASSPAVVRSAIPKGITVTSMDSETRTGLERSLAGVRAKIDREGESPSLKAVADGMARRLADDGDLRSTQPTII